MCTSHNAAQRLTSRSIILVGALSRNDILFSIATRANTAAIPNTHHKIDKKNRQKPNDVSALRCYENVHVIRAMLIQSTLSKRTMAQQMPTNLITICNLCQRIQQHYLK